MKRVTILILITGSFGIACKKRDAQDATACGRLLTQLTPSLDQTKVKTKLRAKNGECSLMLRGATPAADKAISGFLLANGWTVERTETGKSGTFTAYANEASGGCSVTATGSGDCSSADCYSEFKVICFPKQ